MVTEMHAMIAIHLFSFTVPNNYLCTLCSSLIFKHRAVIAVLFRMTMNFLVLAILFYFRRLTTLAREVTSIHPSDVHFHSNI